MSTQNPNSLDVEKAVRTRYSSGAQAREEALCCPVTYDDHYLRIIPQEVIDRDYGCGNPSRYAREGDTLLDLGSGGGKICFIASQIVGPKGHVIGVDMNQDMLDLARRSAPIVAKSTGHSNTKFFRGRIQDLALDLDRVEHWLQENPVQNTEDLSRFEDYCDHLRQEEPMVANNSVDLVVSNCVLNLVRESDKPKLIQEIFRVLKPGGRIAISDIVSDEPCPEELKQDPELWSGCISGAFHEGEILRELEEAGFYGISFDQWDSAPWQTVQGIEFRSVTVTAHKGKEGPCMEANQAVIYRGPWKQVEDDDGHVYRRGDRIAVCEKTFRILNREPYADSIIPVLPQTRIPEEEQKEFNCSRPQIRSPRETKGEDYRENTRASGDCCSPESGS